ncbi:MAG: 2-C-methyl-D-erythritol 4-phosphate cytidylyltransferase [Candidatus Omnitrophica bacterium]|nr:2-C-methyl-D-erythritol 4-phosphate cytidylyltransferase [Candidatus Omnitrophota bacterium]MDE2215214.1 2-C-methyl-D-erythritol 4-phosphate cytidylyltransferase [Candidatus Omnitrophota bacterium]
MKTQVIVVAGGAGKRLNAKIPKALMRLWSRPLVGYSLEIFNAHPDIDGIILVGVKKHLKAFERAAKNCTKVHAVVPGGASRSDSVKCGLKELSGDTDIVLVHDAARPFVDGAMIDRLLAALKKSKTAIVGVPVKFTVKKVNPQTLNIQETPARDLLWEAQTPQGFHKDVLLKAHARRGKQQATDDAVLAERMGQKVKMVMGDYRNIKVTTPEDLVLAHQLLSGRTRKS